MLIYYRSSLARLLTCLIILLEHLENPVSTIRSIGLLLYVQAKRPFGHPSELTIVLHSCLSPCSFLVHENQTMTRYSLIQLACSVEIGRILRTICLDMVDILELQIRYKELHMVHTSTKDDAEDFFHRNQSYENHRIILSRDKCIGIFKICHENTVEFYNLYFSSN